jgi:hypothetical protein
METSDSPNVLVRFQYYEPAGDGRGFYASAQKDDYLNYVDKGIKSDQAIRDYMAYAGNPEKSSGVFGKDGLLSPEDKKALRKELRETKSCIWDAVISFKSDYGKKNVVDWKNAHELLKKTLPAFFKSVGLDPDKTTWYAGLHTNTDNRHIHLSFFQEEPSVYDKKTKGYRYRKGKMPMSKTADFKIAIEKHFLEPVQGTRRVRDLMNEEARKVATGYMNDDNAETRRLLAQLYEAIPAEGETGYASKNMDGCRALVDAISEVAMADGYCGTALDELKEKMAKRDEEIKAMCEKQKIEDPTPYFYQQAFMQDLYRRMGNVIIQEVLKRRKEEREKTKWIRHPKSAQRNHIQNILYLMERAAALNAKLAHEEFDAITDFEERLAKAEHDRLVEEGVIELE